jgi:histidinol-phosphatase
VTEADQNAEKLLRQVIQSHFPSDTIIGEEYGHSEGTSGWSWYIDPIDGTQAFTRGVPLFGSLIGLEKNGKPQGGIIFMPALGELVYAGKGLGCSWIRGLRPDHKGGWMEGVRSKAQVSSISKIKDAMFCTTWMQSFRDAKCLPLFSELSEHVGIFRGWGDCYGYVLVATGRAEIMIDPMLESWDAGPLPVILEEAGGRFTSFDGEVSIHKKNGFATNALLHEEILSLTASYSTKKRT